MRILAIILVLAGATESLALMFNAGSNQNSIVLLTLFMVWVLSPFIALLVAIVISGRWKNLSRVTLYFLVLFITVGSVIIYNGILDQPGTRTSFKFMVVPFMSWLLLLTFIPIAISRSRRYHKRKDFY